MAKHLLDEADIGSVFEHQGGTGMPEQMAAPPLSDVGGIDVGSDELG